MIVVGAGARIALSIAAALTVAACTADGLPQSVAAEPSTPPAAGAPTQQAGTALGLLATLEVKGRAPLTGYERGLFGYRAFETDRNGCETRNDILARDLAGTTTDADTGGCAVLTGALNDPYTGRTSRSTAPARPSTSTTWYLYRPHRVVLDGAGHLVNDMSATTRPGAGPLYQLRIALRPPGAVAPVSSCNESGGPTALPAWQSS